MLDHFLRATKSIIPRSLFTALQPLYHLSLAYAGALLYRFPSHHIIVIGVTGTKGKSSVVEYINAILEADGKKTAVLGTIRFKVGEQEERNLFKMTMPGRMFVQRFLRRAVDAGCTHAIVEMTSEGAKQYRQRGVAMDALVFTNLSPEHIESHGSYENYRDAKLSIARTLARSNKAKRLMIGNADDKETKLFFAIPRLQPVPYSSSDAENVRYRPHGVTFQLWNIPMEIRFPGTFSLANAVAAAVTAKEFGVAPEAIAKGLATLTTIPGRAEEIQAGQSFAVVVDYAHTADSLKSIYEAYPCGPRICVLGSTGGGRDKWKRKVMGEVADRFCTEIILTNEDPYDEDPVEIVEGVKSGIHTHTPQIIMDRRAAIRQALTLAQQHGDGATVLITGKGTDPYIMGPNGSKETWDDRSVAKEELAKLKLDQ